MNFNVNKISELWEKAFMQYIDSSLRAGMVYLPQEQNNIAAMAVQMADSAVEAFKARLTLFSESGTGELSPNATSPSIASLVDSLSQTQQDARPQNISAVIEQGMARFRPQTAQFVPASKPRAPRM